MRKLIFAVVVAIVAVATDPGTRSSQISAADPAKADAAKLEFFEKKVRPILVGHCHACHAAETKPSGGLRVDDRHGLITGGNSGAAIVPGKASASKLIARVTQKDLKKRMPLEGQHLTDEQVAILSRWIDDGAVWPPVKLPSSLGKPKAKYDELKREHWAWQPLGNPPVPKVGNAAWAKDDIDRFVLAKLDAVKLQPVRDADRLTLIRRLTFDLTGLPPTPSEMDGFLKDASPDAVAKLVDRLLGSPAFGEHWGRHWLDVARYGESTGPSRNIPYPHAWKYRDYVIDSLNADVPFDRFLQEQIAGDLLPATNDAESNRQKIATGFLALGVKDVNQRFKERFIMDNVDEQIDAVTRSILALTVSCARCHDHKFDPIPQTDYYALAGIFTSTDNAAGVRNLMGGGGLAYYAPEMLLTLRGELPPVAGEHVEKLKAELADAKAKWDAIRGTPEGLAKAADGFPVQRPFRLKYEKLQTEYDALMDPAARGLAAHGVRDAATIADTELRVRGEAEKRGPVVPRGYLTVFSVPGAPPIPVHQSGRLELAQWLTSTKNPLTDRVAVNRVWSHLFGRGLVATVDNFGVTGDAPSHPELLDHLANRFIANGRSLKQLIRAIVLSRTYQLASDATDLHREQDPGNVWLWRHTPRRLNAEEIRDAMLATAGVLNRERPNGSPAQALKMVEMNDNGPQAAMIHTASDRSRSRSVYLPLVRGLTPRSLEAFDPVDQTLVSGYRETTTVPAQALFLLNSAFVHRQSLALAERELQHGDDQQRLTRLYRLVLGRGPSESERARALAFVAEYESTIREEFQNVRTKTSQPNQTKPATKTAPKKSEEPPVDPDQVVPMAQTVVDDRAQPNDARTAAWKALVQALYASAEFRFVR